MTKLFGYLDISIACKQAPGEGRAVEPVDILLIPAFLDNSGIMNWLVKSQLWLSNINRSLWNGVDGPTRLLRFVTFVHLLFFGNFLFLHQRRIGALKTKCTGAPACPVRFAGRSLFFSAWRSLLADSKAELIHPNVQVVGLLWQWRQKQTKSSFKHVQLLPVLLKLTFGAQIKICQSLYPPMEQIRRYYKLHYISMYYLTNWPISLPLCILIYFFMFVCFVSLTKTCKVPFFLTGCLAFLTLTPSSTHTTFAFTLLHCNFNSGVT